jgi:hypothetical protein
MEQNELAKPESRFDIWNYCFFVLVTVDVLVEVKIHWYTLSGGSKFLGVTLVAYLIVMPLLIMRGERKGRKFRTAQMLFFAYLSVLMATIVFSFR